MGERAERKSNAVGEEHILVDDEDMGEVVDVGRRERLSADAHSVELGRRGNADSWDRPHDEADTLLAQSRSSWVKTADEGAGYGRSMSS
jgi:hypothetical protein